MQPDKTVDKPLDDRNSRLTHDNREETGVWKKNGWFSSIFVLDTDASWLNGTVSTGNLQINPPHANNRPAVILPGLAASVRRFCLTLNKHVGGKISRNE